MTIDGRSAVIGADLVIQGEVRNGTQVEVLGSVLGTLDAEHVIIHPGGRVVGTLTAGSADIRGLLNGRIRVRNLISIAAGGAVHGDVRYGQLALAAGGDLAADVRNIPPEMTGDFELVVRRGRTVRVTSEDLSAFDPDDTPDSLTYHVSNAQHGSLALASAPRTAVVSFTDAAIRAGDVLFVHDGSGDAEAGFDVSVTDHAGASGGDPRRVTVKVLTA